MSGTNEERIERLEKLVAEQGAVIAKLRAVFVGGGAGGHESASADDLDGKYGNPSVRKDPPKWGGVSCVGRSFSECPPEFLDSLAGFLDWRAEKEASDPAKEKYARYSRSDASRARGWAARIRSGWTPPKAAPAPNFGTGVALGGDDGFLSAGGFDEAGDIPF